MQHDPNRGPLESDPSIKLNHTESTVHTEPKGGEGVDRTGKEVGKEEKGEIKGQGESHVGDNSTRGNEKIVGEKGELIAGKRMNEKSVGEENAVNEERDRKSGGEGEVTKEESLGERVDKVDTDSLNQNEGIKEETSATEGGDRIRVVETNSTESTTSDQSTTLLPPTTLNEPKATTADDTAHSSSSLPLPTTSTSSTSPSNPTRSISPNPPSIAPKRFSSSLSVNKKFLEKAGEKANKLETKPTTTRLATPPVPTPLSTSHPRLLTGKISTSNPSIALSSSNSNPSNPNQPSVNWSKKPPPSSSSTNAPSPSATSSAAGKIGPLPGKTNGSSPLVPKSSGPVWSSAGATNTASGNNASGGFGSSSKSYGGIGLGRGSGGGFGNFVGDFPTAAEAAYAKEARARAVMEQMQARERALQARAAAAAAQNANLLQNLDAFRGVHLDPNAHHWDEDEDDFLDTTIEFGDGTQYKITEEDATAAAAAVAAQQQEQALRAAQTGARTRLAGEEDLREPSPSELARLETPLAPGEVDEQPVKSREERFGDDYDRSWPPKRPIPPPQQEKPRRPSHTEKDDANRNLFNDRLGKFEPAQHGHPPPPASHRRMSNSSTGQDLPPHLLDRRDPSKSLPSRRPSITSPRTRHQQLPTQPHHHEPPASRNAWPRRPSNDLPLPSHGRQLPPHLAAASNVPHHSSIPTSTRPPPTPAAPSLKSPPIPSEVFSPPQPLAALPEAVAPVEVPVHTEADLEALHAREMHAAAERAKKRRQEEEQARLEQMERARKKAAELEAKMEAKETAPVVEQKKEEKVEEKVSVVEKEKVSSWRATAKPPVVQSPPVSAPPPSTTSHPTKILGREPSTSSTSTQQPTTILPRPAQPSSPITEQTSTLPSISAVAPPPPTQLSAWRRPSNPSSLPPPTGPRSQQRQLPPHLAQQVQPPPVSPSPNTDTAAISPSLPSVETVEKPVSPPAIASPPTVPSSPSHERKSSAKSNPLGYKVPEVSQLDDLMSRIKGAMSAKEAKKEVPIEILEREVREVKVVLEKEKAKDVVPSVETIQGPTVKLPPSTKPSRSRSNDQPLASTSASIPTEPRGRGRGRSDGPRAPRVSLPTFENRDPLLPFSGTRRARSPSPPPAWKLYPVKIPARPPHKAPHVRNVKAFLSIHTPRPAHVFSSNPLIHGINPRRLNRDDMLIPKKYVKGVPQCLVKLPSERITRRTQEEERASQVKPKPTPTVSISSKALLIRSAGLDGPESATTKEELATVTPPSESTSSAPRGRGRGRMPDSGSWRRAGESSETPLATEVSPELEVVAEQVEDVKSAAPPSAGETSPSRSRGGAGLKSKLPLGSSIGFYRSSGAPPLDEADTLAKDRSESAKTFMVTSELNGEKVEATPREETTAPGADLAAQSKMTPKSPPFKPKDMTGVLSSPSAAWTNKSLALSVLDPTASSVWSAAPVDTSAHARVISGNQPENSLQGIVDDDPSEALPSSLAELKSEDEQSNEGKETPVEVQRLPSKDDAKLRAVAPSFSSFLHDSAAAIDTSSSALPASALPSSYHQQTQHRPQPLAFSGYSSHHSIPPQSTPSPVNPYSPSTTAYSPQLYGNPASHYTRSYPSTYGLTSAASVSPYVTQPTSVASSLHHQVYSPASPIVSPMGYPLQSPSTAYARPPPPPPSQSIPHGITNPALLASYNGGYGSARYGAVGAGPRPNPSQSTAPPSNPSLFSHGGRPSYGAAPHQTPSYLSQQQQQHQQSSPYATSAYLPSSSPYSQPQTQPHSYRTEPTYPTNSYDYPTSSRPYTGGGNSSTTMPSPVIVPQNLPPPPPFFPQSQSTGVAPNGYGIGSRIGGRFASSGAVGGGSGSGRPW